MAGAARFKPTEIPYYEGLIRKTAAMCAPRVQEDYEDIVSIFRVKVWRALLTYNPERSTMTIERYVFSCVKNQEKDLLKRKRRQEVFCDVMPDVDAVDHDEVFEDVERELPLIPSTLSLLERQVIVRLYMDVSQREIAEALRLTKADMERTMRSIRDKMADWRPGAQPALQAA